jgi:hypothetical protein
MLSDCVDLEITTEYHKTSRLSINSKQALIVN